MQKLYKKLSHYKYFLKMKYINEISKKLNIKGKDKTFVANVIKTYLAMLREDLLNGKIVYLHNILSLRKEIMPAKIVINPRNGEKIHKDNYFKIKMSIFNSFKKDLDKKKIYKGE